MSPRFKRLVPLFLLNLIVLGFMLMHVTSQEGEQSRWFFIDQMENLSYDARIMLTMPDQPDDRVVIVDIDEYSLAELGRWPWSRDHMSLMVERLFDDYGARVVGFDVVFAEPDDSSGLRILEQLAEEVFSDMPLFSEQLQTLRDTLDFDRMFADSLSDRSVVLGYYFRQTEEAGGNPGGQLPAPILTVDDFRPGSGHALKANGYGANLAVLQQQAAGGGHFNPDIDRDGIVRRIPMLYQYEDGYYESLSLAVVRQVLEIESITPVYAEPGPLGYRHYSGLEWLGIGQRLVPVDERLRVLVPYRGRQGTFPYVSAADVIGGRADREVLQDRIILVGTSAPGLFDLRATPMQSEYPGVEIHANLVAGLLDQTIKEKPAYTLGAEFMHVLVIGLAMLCLPLVSPLIAGLVFIGLLAGSIAMNLWIWNAAHLVLPIASVLILMLIMFLFNMSYGFFVEQRGKRQLSGLFGQYIPPELVDEMSENPESYSLEAENRDMTVLFSDVRNFTTISESMQPAELSDLMNEILTPMTRIIHSHRGTIDKYMGDAIMAFWGAPLYDSQHARHAVQAALDMIRAIAKLQPAFAARGWPEIRVGVGINTGDMSVGNMGSEFRRAYTVLGDAVNLGSRLEGLTKPYGVNVLVSEFTRSAVPDYAFREVDRVRVKGRDEPVAIYEPLGLTAELDKVVRDELKLYQQALRHYRDQEWDLAELQLLNLQKQSSLKLYRVYIERVQYFRDHPPPNDWDGVFTHTEK